MLPPVPPTAIDIPSGLNAIDDKAAGVYILINYCFDPIS
jgi:hypothetical protein